MCDEEGEGRGGSGGRSGHAERLTSTDYWLNVSLPLHHLPLPSSLQAYDKELDYLKEKVEAGSSCIITQMFFDPQVFIQFVKDCRLKGITVPIIPGLMLIQNLAGFKRMVSFCKSRVPLWVSDSLEAVKDDDSKVKEAGAQIAVEMIKTLAAAGVKGVHLYTLNLEQVTFMVLKELGLYKASGDDAE